MIRALLGGTKSQTRRIVKPDPGPYWNPVVGLCNPAVIDNSGYDAPGPEIFGASDETAGRKFPHGGPAHCIWVRETFFAYGRWETRYTEKKQRDEWHFIDMTTECGRAYQYDADSPDVSLATGRGGALPGWYKRPAIFMPRAASRILLEIVSVRVERLNDLSEADAIAEGIEQMPCEVPDTKLWRNYRPENGWTPRVCMPQNSFRSLWESINGEPNWLTNPWVWVVEFKRVAP
ncbi:hypothetical protein [Duganella callida]|nr:hypothetical protein [Duganella callida]